MEMDKRIFINEKYMKITLFFFSSEVVERRVNIFGLLQQLSFEGGFHAFSGVCARHKIPESARWRVVCWCRRLMKISGHIQISLGKKLIEFLLL
jgi:hypothetical protein